ncbi:hypothetical protein COO91_10270 (plasmid) [Nostoc flagelliforme CCNUN1]|uniref:Uncharacterized protein n=1 Tax=Nostoc flagelliforme CCNUN1 TaxID=2038116 RepID=A0A2K8T8N1_9NOSO|nr:hypothetical protein COO91_10270 [Nostoc flagelliforme CCNUN1]
MGGDVECQIIDHIGKYLLYLHRDGFQHVIIFVYQDTPTKNL